MTPPTSPAAHELLGTPDSALAGLLRFGLRGLRAALAEALPEHADDPGAAACARYLVELDEQLTVAGPPDVPTDDPPAEQTTRLTAQPPAQPSPQPPVLTPVPDPAPLLEQPSAPDWLRTDTRPRPVVEQWQRFHVAALRLSEMDARRWWSLVEGFGPISGSSGSTTWHTLPGDFDAVLVPPLLGRPGWRTSPDAPADQDVLERLRVADPRSGGPQAELARLASTVLAMTELDVDLYFGLESIRYLGLSRLDEPTRQAFRRDLLDRLATYGATRYGTPESFTALLLVDEALHSVLHLPAPAPGSWWSRLRDRSRALVYAAQNEHPGVAVQLLARQYREIKAMTGGNDIRFPHDGSGVVLGCLRLWARVDGVELPGRVVYAG